MGLIQKDQGLYFSLNSPPLCVSHNLFGTPRKSQISNVIGSFNSSHLPFLFLDNERTVSYWKVLNNVENIFQLFQLYLRNWKYSQKPNTLTPKASSWFPTVFHILPEQESLNNFQLHLLEIKFAQNIKFFTLP